MASAASIGRKRAEEHRQAAQQLGEGDAEASRRSPVGLEEPGVAGERRAVVVGLRHVGVERLARSPAARELKIDALAVLRRDRHGGDHEHDQRHADRAEHDELDLARLDLLAQELGRAADHQPGDEDGEQDEQQHPVQAGADAAEDDLAGHHVAPSGPRRRVPLSDSIAAFTAPHEATVVTAANSEGRADAEALLLALHVAPSRPAACIAGGAHAASAA